jgi:hypothetical protein
MHERTPPSTPQDTEAETTVDDIAEPVLQLARTFSHTRTFSALSTNINPFLTQDSRLDPKSPDFEPESWVKALLHAFSKDPSKHPRYTAGVSWRNLSVHGFSDPTEYQKDVFNVIWRSPLAALDWFAKRKQKVKIISEFDGLVKSGELLLVLGRPGRYVIELTDHLISYLTLVQWRFYAAQDDRWTYPRFTPRRLIRVQLPRYLPLPSSLHHLTLQVFPGT